MMGLFVATFVAVRGPRCGVTFWQDVEASSPAEAKAKARRAVAKRAKGPVSLMTFKAVS